MQVKLLGSTSSFLKCQY